MSILGSLLGYAIVKGICNEVRIADYKAQDRKLAEINDKYMGGKYKGYMSMFKTNWDEYCDEVNPWLIKFGREPYTKNIDRSPEEQKKIKDFQEWKKKNKRY